MRFVVVVGNVDLNSFIAFKTFIENTQDLMLWLNIKMERGNFKRK